ncbi:hypothetical protein GGF50DRAFT_109811 [Schizophyllum commune]
MPPPSSSHALGGSPVARDYQPSGSTVPSLGGGDAKTPMIAGSVCGGLMAIAWIIGFTIYFRKRWKRKIRNRKRRAGLEVPLSPHEGPEAPQEKVVIPPDPAVLAGLAKPGSDAFEGMEALRKPRITRGLSRAKGRLEGIFEQDEKAKGSPRPSTSAPALDSGASTASPSTTTIKPPPPPPPPRHSRKSSRETAAPLPPSSLRFDPDTTLYLTMPRLPIYHYG